MQKVIDNLEFIQGVNFDFINSLKKSIPCICSFLMTHVQKFALLRSLWTLLSLADIAGLVVFLLNTNNSAKVK